MAWYKGETVDSKREHRQLEYTVALPFELFFPIPSLSITSSLHLMRLVDPVLSSTCTESANGSPLSLKVPETRILEDPWGDSDAVSTWVLDVKLGVDCRAADMTADSERNEGVYSDGHTEMPESFELKTKFKIIIVG